MGVGGPDDVGDVGDDGAIFFLALPQRLLGAHRRGHIAEAPDAADRHTVDDLRLRRALEDPAVLEVQYVEAFDLRLVVEFLHPLHEAFRIFQLFHRECDRALVVVAFRDVVRDPPHTDELPVEASDLAVSGNNEDADGRRLERGFEER